MKAQPKLVEIKRRPVGVQPGTVRGKYRPSSESRLKTAAQLRISKQNAKAARAKRYVPSKKDRNDVEFMIAAGIKEGDIARILGISTETMTKYFEYELATGLAKKNKVMADSLYQTGKKGNVTAQIFWLKTRARWRESELPPPPGSTPQDNFRLDFSRLTDQEGMALRLLLQKATMEPPRQLTDGKYEPAQD